MATSSFYATFDGSTVANFVAWAKPIADFLKAQTGILTQTADTNQVNWATISVIPTNGTFVWESYKLVDPAGSTYNPPIYMRIGYGGTFSNLPVLRTEFGTGPCSGGSAASPPTGLLSQVVAANSATASSGPADAVNQYPCLFSSDNSSYLMVHMFNGWHAVSGASMGFIIERSRNADGSVNGDGFSYWTLGTGSIGSLQQNGNIAAWQSFSWAKPVPGWGNLITGQCPCAFSAEFDLQVGTTVYTLPIVTQYGKPAQGQFMGAVIYAKADLPDRTTFVQSVNGVNHTYYCTGTLLSSGTNNPLGNGPLAIAVRYD